MNLQPNSSVVMEFQGRNSVVLFSAELSAFLLVSSVVGIRARGGTTMLSKLLAHKNKTTLLPSSNTHSRRRLRSTQTTQSVVVSFAEARLIIRKNGSSRQFQTISSQG
jgi:hypothetical protein